MGMNMQKTVTELMQEISDEICNEYCKYPEIVMAEKKDAAEANDLLFETYCVGCPLNRL